MSITDISLRKRMALKLFARQKQLEAREHQLNYLMWECTLRCNLSCEHCGSDCRRDAAVKDMPLKDFLRAVDSIAPAVDRHRTTIVLTGGEPLMRNDLEECGREFYKREFPWGMVTNGLAMTPQRLDRLIACGLRSVTVSLDGLGEVHNRMRGNKKSFDAAVNAIKALVARGDDLVYDVVTTVSPESYPQLDQIAELLISIGVPQWRIFTVFPIGRAVDNEHLQLNAQQFREVFEFIKKTRKEGRIKVSYGCEGFLGNYEADVRDSFFFCRAGVKIASVLADGSISACPNLRENFIQGNIYRDDMLTVWNQRFEPHRNREWARTGECSDCKYFKYCEGSGLHLRDEQGNLLFCHLNRIKEGEAAQRVIK